MSAPGAATAPAGLMSVAATDEPVDYLLQGRPLLQGDRLVQATTGIDSRDGRPVVSFRFELIRVHRRADPAVPR
jgi:preprotein translocase subunit SecD